MPNNPSEDSQVYLLKGGGQVVVRTNFTWPDRPDLFGSRLEISLPGAKETVFTDFWEEDGGKRGITIRTPSFPVPGLQLSPDNFKRILQHDLGKEGSFVNQHAFDEITTIVNPDYYGSTLSTS